MSKKSFNKDFEDINNLDDFTLMDTVNLMNSNDYKDRFIAEYIQTKIRYKNLNKIIIKYENNILDFIPVCDISILEDQAYYMGHYLKQLEIRAVLENIKLPKFF